MDLGTALGLIAGVLVVSALAAGLVERAPLSFPMLFLGLGFAVGDRGLGLISIGLDSRLLEVVAIVTLALVLFLDAVNLELTELRRDWLAPLLVLGPATLLVAGLLAGAGMLLLDLPVVLAALLGIILASIDPVVLRDVLRDPRRPRSVRRTLSVEAGTNDLVVLPILLVLIAIAHADLGGPAEWPGFLGQLLVLGPAAGFAVGAAGSWVMGRVDQRFHQHGFAWLPEDDFVNHFAADVDPQGQGHVRGPAAVALERPRGGDGRPGLEVAAVLVPGRRRRQFAPRMGATTVEVSTNHVAMVSHPDEVLQLIKTAAEAVPAAT